MPDYELTFQQNQVSRLDLLTVARGFIHLPYVSGKAWARRVDNGWRGHSDCAGFPILVARECGLLPPDFPCDLPFPIFGRSREKVLLEIIELNMFRIPVDEAIPGDIYFIGYPGVAEHERGGRHIAFLSASKPEPLGAILHAWCDMRGVGSVFEQRLTQRDFDCIKSAYRLNIWGDR